VTDHSLDRGAPEQLHSQLSNNWLSRIRSGEWPTHFKLPSEPDLAEHFQVSRGTVRRSLETLTDHGYVTRVHGRGTFVLPVDIEQPMSQELLSLSEALDRQGLAFTTRVLRISVTVASPEVRRLFRLASTEEVLYLRRLRVVSGVAVALLDNYVRLDAAASLSQRNYAEERLFDSIEHAFGQSITKAERTFRAVAASLEQSELMDVKRRSPLLYLEQQSYLADSTPVEFSKVWLRGDRLRVTSTLRRMGPPDVG
jgi:GntR family transcriptional regulator